MTGAAELRLGLVSTRQPPFQSLPNRTAHLGIHLNPQEIVESLPADLYPFADFPLESPVVHLHLEFRIVVVRVREIRLEHGDAQKGKDS